MFFIFRRITVNASGIRAWVVMEVGVHADHYTDTLLSFEPLKMLS